MKLWDKMAGMFGGGKGKEDVPKGIADNVLIAFPKMIELIQRNFPITKGRRALDFGCGSGRFAKELHGLGFLVTGIDISEEMISAAREYLPTDVRLLTGSLEQIREERAFDLVTASMVFQFIREIDVSLRTLDRLIKPAGILALSVFNPPFVSDLLKAKVVFKDFDSVDFPTHGLMELVKGTRIPVYLRGAEEYTGLLTCLGYEKVFETAPPFTEEFLKKYPVPFPTQDPEFLILGFQKSSAS
jgi:2-polyprenyl-3-methyl-5-hydroxy-6-metoxy-1,4-benzoquinol methylase